MGVLLFFKVVGVRTMIDRKKIAWVLFGMGLLLATPPIFPSPDDIFNLFVGKLISNYFNISIINGIIVSYTILPLIIFSLAVLVYPKESNKVINMFSNKVKMMFNEYVDMVKTEPVHLLWILLLLLIMLYIYQWYAGQATNLINFG